MWIIYQITGSALIACSLAYVKECGFCFKTWITYVIVVCCFTSWIFPLSFTKGPSFFQVWIFGVIILSLFGAIISVFYFKEILDVINYIGAGIALIGITLLIL